MESCCAVSALGRHRHSYTVEHSKSVGNKAETVVGFEQKKLEILLGLE